MICINMLGSILLMICSVLELGSQFLNIKVSPLQTAKPELNLGACNGDSGGPLHCYIHDKWYWSGIVSFGASGCDTNIASVYGKVYHDEIQNYINQIIAENL